MRDKDTKLLEEKYDEILIEGLSRYGSHPALEDPELYDKYYGTSSEEDSFDEEPEGETTRSATEEDIANAELVSKYWKRKAEDTNSFFAGGQSSTIRTSLDRMKRGVELSNDTYNFINHQADRLRDGKQPFDF